MSSRVRVLLVVPLLVILACAEVRDASEESQEVIVYTTLRPENQDIYLVDGPDAEPRRMTEHLALDYNATFSPDGRWLVFTSERKGNADLYALDLEERREPVRLTRNPAMEDAADVSPDGTWGVFFSDRGGWADEPLLSDDPQPYGDLWAVPVDGGDAVRLTDDKWEDGLAQWATR